jgi:hypothetical protein
MQGSFQLTGDFFNARVLRIEKIVLVELFVIS